MKKQSPEATRLLDEARMLAVETMELHVLSVRMGAGTESIDDLRSGQSIIARSAALIEDINRFLEEQ